MTNPSPVVRLMASIDAIDALRKLSNAELSKLICEHIMGEMDIMGPQYALLDVVRERLEDFDPGEILS